MDLKGKIEDLENEIRELHAEFDVNPTPLYANVTGGGGVPVGGAERVLNRRAQVEKLNRLERELAVLYRKDGLSEEESWVLLRKLGPPRHI